MVLFLALAPSAHHLVHWLEDAQGEEHLHAVSSQPSICSDGAHHSCDSCQIIAKHAVWAEVQREGVRAPELRSTLIRGLSSGLWNVFRGSASNKGPPSER